MVNGLEITPGIIKVFAEFESDKQKRITQFIKKKTLQRKNSIDPFVAKKVLLDYLNREESHMTVKKIAQENDVSRQAVYNVVKKFNE